MGKSSKEKSGNGRSIWKGLVAGAVGGLAASWVMNNFQTVWEGVAQVTGIEDEGGSGKGGSKSGASNGSKREEEPATVKAAEAISETILGRELTTEEKTIAGPGMHYLFGATVGALYGATAEIFPSATVGVGTPFGTAVWLVADEIVVPALGLSKSPKKYDLSTHGYALTSHLVYGLTSDVVRRTVRKALD